MNEVVKAEFASFAVFEPLLTDLITADVEIPNMVGDVGEILLVVDPDLLLGDDDEMAGETVPAALQLQAGQASSWVPSPKFSGPQEPHGLRAPPGLSAEGVSEADSKALMQLVERQALF